MDNNTDNFVKSLYKLETRREFHKNPRLAAIKYGVIKDDSNMEVKVVNSTKDIFYIILPDDSYLENFQLLDIQAAGSTSTAGCAGTISTVGTFAFTIGTAGCLSTLGSAGSKD